MFLEAIYICVTATSSIASAPSEIVNAFAKRSLGTVYLAAFNSFEGVFRQGFPKTMKTC